MNMIYFHFNGFICLKSILQAVRTFNKLLHRPTTHKLLGPKIFTDDHVYLSLNFALKTL